MNTQNVMVSNKLTNNTTPSNVIKVGGNQVGEEDLIEQADKEITEINKIYQQKRMMSNLEYGNSKNFMET